VRLALVLVLAGLAFVAVIAVWIDPYEEGKPVLMGSHTLKPLNLPECSFAKLTRTPSRQNGLPCPSCGLTSSFSLLAHGDVKNSLRANAVGTLMALFCVTLVPWGVLSLVRGRLLGVPSIERALTWIVAVFLTLLLVRWGIILALGWLPP
jgi:hypothetical protein